jgi:hypothetical protein
MNGAGLPQWEQDLVEETIAKAEARLEAEEGQADERALQLAREQGYHRLALAIDRPSGPAPGPGQLRLWRNQDRLFEDAG